MRHKRCDEEITAYRGKSAKSQQAANRRWGKDGQVGEVAAKSGRDIGVMPPVTDGIANPTATENGFHADALPPLTGGNANAMPTVNQEPLTSNQKPVRSKAESASATRLPANWQPSVEDGIFCQTTRPELDPVAIADQFRDYWIAQPDAAGRKTNWSATWRNWVRKERSGGQARASPQRPAMDLAAVQRAANDEAKRMLFGDIDGGVIHG